MSLFEQRLADLPLSIDDYTLERLERDVSSQFTRVSTVIHLRGGGEEGVGEDVTYAEEDQQDQQARGPVLPLAGQLQDRPRGLEGVLVDGVVGDVLADALLARPVEVDERRDAGEGRRDVALQALERVALDAQGQVGEALLEEAHDCSSLATSSSRRSSSRPLPTASSSPAQNSTSPRPSRTSSSVSRSPASPESRRLMIASRRAVAAS